MFGSCPSSSSALGLERCFKKCNKIEEESEKTSHEDSEEMSKDVDERETLYVGYTRL